LNQANKKRLDSSRRLYERMENEEWNLARHSWLRRI